MRFGKGHEDVISCWRLFGTVIPAHTQRTVSSRPRTIFSRNFFFTPLTPVQGQGGRLWNGQETPARRLRAFTRTDPFEQIRAGAGATFQQNFGDIAYYIQGEYFFLSRGWETIQQRARGTVRSDFHLADVSEKVNTTLGLTVSLGPKPKAPAPVAK